MDCTVCRPKPCRTHRNAAAVGSGAAAIMIDVSGGIGRLRAVTGAARSGAVRRA